MCVLAALVTPQILLCPYSEHHVPTYHEWMKDEVCLYRYFFIFCSLLLNINIVSCISNHLPFLTISYFASSDTHNENKIHIHTGTQRNSKNSQPPNL